MPEPIPEFQPTTPIPKGVPRRSSPRPASAILRPGNDRLRGRRQPLKSPPITSDHSLLANNPGRTSPQRPDVYVFTHDFDLAADFDYFDLDERTWSLLAALEPTANKGCFYVNPLHTVTCPAPTPEFYREAAQARFSWLKKLRGTIDNIGVRRMSRSFGPTKRQSYLTGFLFIDGVQIPQPEWNKMADELLAFDFSKASICRRRVDLSALKASGDTGPLEQVARDAIRHHLDTTPAHAAFITPLATVSAPIPTEAFYLRAERHKIEWCRLLKRAIGNGGSRRLRRSVELRALTLALSGILVVDGQLYLPGFWPNQEPTLRQLKQTPFNSRTVPADYLGLD